MPDFAAPKFKWPLNIARDPYQVESDVPELPCFFPCMQGIRCLGNSRPPGNCHEAGRRAGPEMPIDLNNSHVIPALIRRLGARAGFPFSLGEGPRSFK